MSAPNVLTRALAAAAREHEKQTAEHAEMLKRNKDRARKYTAARFCRLDAKLSDFFKDWSREVIDDGDSVQDIQSNFWEANLDFGYYSGAERDAWKNDGDDALEMFRHLCPDAPITADRIETLRADLLRAKVDAQRGECESAFYDWMLRHIASACDAIGMRWAWIDDKGEPVTHPAEAAAVGFACTRAEYRKLTERQSYETVREYLDDREDKLREIIDDALEDAKRNGTPEDFDPRGQSYYSDDEWPLLFADYCETADAWRADVKRMRAKLAGAIRARAPLHVRAEIVASVYGTPGEREEVGE
jgi:hypothetical protein